MRELRQLAGEMQGEIAARAEISAMYLSQIERGKRKTVSPRVFVRLCDALGVEDRRTLISEEAAA